MLPPPTAEMSNGTSRPPLPERAFQTAGTAAGDHDRRASFRRACASDVIPFDLWRGHRMPRRSYALDPCAAVPVTQRSTSLIGNY